MVVCWKLHQTFDNNCHHFVHPHMTLYTQKPCADCDQPLATLLPYICIYFSMVNSAPAIIPPPLLAVRSASKSRLSSRRRLTEQHHSVATAALSLYSKPHTIPIHLSPSVTFARIHRICSLAFVASFSARKVRWIGSFRYGTQHRAVSVRSIAVSYICAVCFTRCCARWRRLSTTCMFPFMLVWERAYASAQHIFHTASELVCGVGVRVCCVVCRDRLEWLVGRQTKRQANIVPCTLVHTIPFAFGAAVS